MSYVDFTSIISFLGLFVGILLLTIGLYSRRGGRLRYRQGAQVLAGFAALLGLAVVAVGLLALLRA